MVVKKDRGAMKFLYDRYAEYLSAVCGRYIADENDRKDVLQECFIKILCRSLHSSIAATVR